MALHGCRAYPWRQAKTFLPWLLPSHAPKQRTFCPWLQSAHSYNKHVAAACMLVLHTYACFTVPYSVQASVFAFYQVNVWWASAGESILVTLRRLAMEDPLRSMYDKYARWLWTNGYYGQAVLAWIIIVVMCFFLLGVSA